MGFLFVLFWQLCIQFGNYNKIVPISEKECFAELLSMKKFVKTYMWYCISSLFEITARIKAKLMNC